MTIGIGRGTGAVDGGGGDLSAVSEVEIAAGRRKAVPEAVAIVVMASVLVYVRMEFSSRADPAPLSAWLAYMWACVAGRAAILSFSFIPPLVTRLGVAAKVRAGQCVTAAFCAGIVASVWILMPAADDLLRMLMIILCMWFIAMVIILNADRVSVIGALAVVASMAGFVLIREVPFAVPLAGFLVMEGAALVLIRRTISRSAATLQHALRMVEQERDAKTRFIASASHDLQQPLQAAQLYFESVLRGDAPQVRERAILGARTAFSSTQALLGDMLEHLRLEANAMHVKLRRVALQDCLAAVALEHEPTARAAAIEIRVVPARAEIVADEQLLRRILGNLVVNAIQHSGGTRLLLGARRQGGRLHIWVIDNGRGVPPDDAQRLFEEYYQVRSPSARVGGFGIGLASARRMAELMTMTLTLEQGWTGGCAFRLSQAAG